MENTEFKSNCLKLSKLSTLKFAVVISNQAETKSFTYLRNTNPTSHLSLLLK